MRQHFKSLVMNDLRDNFVPCLAEAFHERFELSISTEWNIFNDRYVTTAEGGWTMTQEHHAFIRGFEAAWQKAQGIVAERKE